MTEFRRDPITDRWVIVVPGRAARPNEHAAGAPSTAAAVDCPFCEGNETRTPPEVAALGAPGRLENGPGWYVRTIPNRFPTVLEAPPEPDPATAGQGFETRRGFGYHEVVIESPAHSPLLPFLPVEQVTRVLRMCRDRVRALSERDGVGSVTLFENTGPESGGSLWHPHSQLVATAGLSPALAEELAGADRYRRQRGVPCAFEDIAGFERAARARVLFETPEFLAYAPFASAYPYEVRLHPIRHAPSYAHATERELEALADRLPGLLRALLTVIPGASYNLVLQSPVGASPGAREYHWHLDLYPRLVRPDGFDLGSGFHVNTVSPEGAAELLRAALGAKL